jgi:hypothetical protein
MNSGNFRRVLATAVATAAAFVACDGGDRPSDAAWHTEWEEQRDAFPSADALLSGGRELCDRLVGELRAELPALVPTPTEALDDAVQAWSDHAETIAFECRDDPAELAEQYDQLDILAAEIDSGLAAGQDT